MEELSQVNRSRFIITQEHLKSIMMYGHSHLKMEDSPLYFLIFLTG